MNISSSPPHNLPTQPTPFIGRADDIAEITTLLDEDTCRLLTLLGPGGIGKTRLAIEVALRIVDFFPDGIYFVPLQPLNASDFLASAIADAIDFTFYGREEPKTQLLRYLQDKAMLLILDNFEHLLEGVDLPTTILANAPQVKLLVTSREVLNVQEEWVWRVRGMPFPMRDEEQAIETYSAVQLFANHARRVRGDFSLSEDGDHVVRICQLVEGMPLALELAATWLKVLTCQEIVAEIQKGLNILESNVRNVPERHRNMQAVFSYSWTLMTEGERTVFKKLSVFRGGFRREAAQEVAEATLFNLSALVDKSMIRMDATGRYDVHELLRQFAEEKLAEKSGEQEQVQDGHAIYYMNFLHQLESDLKGSQQLAALEQIETEIDNVRIAWQRAVQRRMHEDMGKALDSLALFYHNHQWGQEASEAFAMAAESLKHNRMPLLGRLQAWRSIFLEGIGGELLIAGVSMLRELGVYGAVAFPLWELSHGDKNAMMRQQTQQFIHKNLAALMEKDDQWGIAYCLIGLGEAWLLDENYEEAYTSFQQGLLIFREIGNQMGISSALHGFVKVARARSALEEGRKHLLEIIRLSTEIGDVGGIMSAKRILGLFAFQQAKYEEARQLFEEALKSLRQMGGETRMFWNISAHLAFIEGDYQRARYYCSQGLQSSLDDGSKATIAWVLLWTVRVLRTRIELDRTVELLVAVQLHSSKYRSIVDAHEINTLFAELEAALPPDIFAAARQRGQSRDLKSIATEFLEELTSHDESLDGATPQISGLSNQLLIDPLSERELEVLSLIAEGLQNQEIADRLYIVKGTVKAHINAIYRKLDVRNRVEAIKKAGELELI